MEKDGLIEAFYRHGRFPADRGAHKTREGKVIRGAGHIETEIKSNYWYEFLQIFAPVGVLAMVLYMFYNALPTTYTESLNRQNVIKKAEQLQKTEINLQKQELLTHPAGHPSTDQDSLLAKAMTMYTDLSKNPSVRKIVSLPELTEKGLKNEMLKHQPAVDTILTQKNALQDLKTKFPAPRARQAPNQVAKQSNSNPAKRAHAQVSQQKAGQHQTDIPVQNSEFVHKSTSQKPIPTKSITTKPSPAKAALQKQAAKQSGEPKLPDKRTQVQSTSAPKPKSTKLKAASNSGSTSK